MMYDARAAPTASQRRRLRKMKLPDMSFFLLGSIRAGMMQAARKRSHWFGFICRIAATWPTFSAG
jgi:hypothetical protein